jgi:hypothetical protein
VIQAIDRRVARVPIGALLIIAKLLPEAAGAKDLLSIRHDASFGNRRRADV